jgi:AraC-like DNA-binding protein
MSALASLSPGGRMPACTAPGKPEEALLAAPTLYSGLRALCDVAATQWSNFGFWLRETERAVWVCSLLRVTGNEVGIGQQVQSRLIRLVGLIQQYLGSQWRPDAILLETVAEPSMLFLEIMDCPRVITNAGFSALPIPKKLLAETGPLYRSRAGDHGGSASGDPDMDWSWLRSLQAILPEYVKESNIRIDLIAEISGVSTRTLQRALAEEGMSFRQLVDEARIRLACQKLAHPAIKVNEVSQLLGYSDATHFTRSFRRLVGRTPREYRREIALQP